MGGAPPDPTHSRWPNTNFQSGPTMSGRSTSLILETRTHVIRGADLDLVADKTFEVGEIVTIQ